MGGISGDCIPISLVVLNDANTVINIGINTIKVIAIKYKYLNKPLITLKKLIFNFVTFSFFTYFKLVFFVIPPLH